MATRQAMTTAHQSRAASALNFGCFWYSRMGAGKRLIKRLRVAGSIRGNAPFREVQLGTGAGAGGGNGALAGGSAWKTLKTGASVAAGRVSTWNWSSTCLSSLRQRALSSNSTIAL